MSDWQPIETAPKDGRGLLLIDADAQTPEAGTGYWAYGFWTCVDPTPGEGVDRETIQAIRWVKPTHWMPLPEAPARTAQTGADHV